ncbi:MAG: glycosyltransferase [Lachnospiraceae bacterium]|nr:glycosyltransferase [Lachnospiraceae bacterium]
MAPSDFTEVGDEELSVIVAVYNIETYLEKCVRSIINQTYKKLEIILVDDGSTDHSGEICDLLAKEDSRIRVIHKKNGGLSDARNAGIEIATGEFIAFVDGDDWIDSDMYESMLYELKKYHADVVICSFRKIYNDKIVDESTGKVFCYEGKEALRRVLSEVDSVRIQNAVWNKVCRKAFLGEQRFPKGKWYEDVVFTTKFIARASRCIYLDSSKYNYVMDRKGSIMNVGFSQRILTDLIPAYLEKAAFLKEIREIELLHIHQYFYYKNLLLWYLQLYRSKDVNKFRFMNEIRNRIVDELPIDSCIYNWEGANRNEKRKLDLFVVSPLLYVITTSLFNCFLCPMKQRLRKLLK